MRCSSDIFLSSRPRTVPDWQPRSILLGMVEARSVNECDEHNNNMDLTIHWSTTVRDRRVPISVFMETLTRSLRQFGDL